ncbi:hypothetical protein [Rossellomorea marisflavi]|uniref:hypothetical protein n=1 Tax=Rossellomorea marisflavi TaxID=189381 RepID=UPI0012E13FCF|nr:hypothetical protein [Rossellomorea marisflavi]
MTYGYDWVRPTSGAFSKKYTVNSTGGDFSVLIDPQTGVHGTVYVQLWEHDETNSDDYVGQRTVSGTSGLVRARWNDIGGYKDGDNNKAEFYIKISGSNNKIEYSDLGYYD